MEIRVVLYSMINGIIMHNKLMKNRVAGRSAKMGLTPGRCVILHRNYAIRIDDEGV